MVDRPEDSQYSDMPSTSEEGDPLVASRHDHHETNQFALFKLLISATAQAAMAVCARGAALRGMSSGGILFVRGAVSSLYTIAALLFSGEWRNKLSGGDIGRLCLRGCVTTGSLYLQFAALHSLAVGSVVSLLYTAAAWTLILMVILDKSPFTRTHVVVILIKAIGAILVVERAPIAAFEAVVAAALSSIAAVLLAGRSDRITPSHATITVGLLSILAGFFLHDRAADKFLKSHDGHIAIASAVASAVFGVMSQLLLTSAALAVPTSTAVVTRSLGVPFTFVFATFILHEQIHIASLVGAAFILVAVALSAFKLHCESMLMDERT